MQSASEALYIIRKSGWNDDAKNAFIISAHSLLNLLITAIFPIEALEKSLESGKLMVGVCSPAQRVKELWDLADKAESVDYHCAYAVSYTHLTLPTKRIV